MKWVLLGKREDWMFEKYLKITAMNKGLKRLTTNYYSNIISNKTGEIFVLENEHKKVIDSIKSQDYNFINKMKNISINITKLSTDQFRNYDAIIKLMEEYLTLFIAGRKIAENIFISGKKDRIAIIEKWRNDPTLFDAFDLFRKKLSKKLKISEINLGLLTPYEVKGMIKDAKVYSALIKKRKEKPWTVSLNKNKISIIYKLLNPIKKETKSDLISGSPAYISKEKIIGIVGEDILVEKMTTVEMIQKIKNKKAIITDEGGILSHAAIIAREWKIPCIVGTKNATKLLKNGDKVEVNSEKGTVKKIY